MADHRGRALAIVPARGGSKRIPRKNIRLMHGKPIITWVLETLRKSKIFDEIHVSTEDDEIYNLVSDSGFEPKFKRNELTSSDYAPVKDVSKFVLKEYFERGQYFETFAVVYPTSIFLSYQELRMAFRCLLTCKNIKKIVSICEYPVPIQWAYEKDTNGMLKPISKSHLEKRSQDIPKTYYETSDFVLYDVKSFMESNDCEDAFGFEVSGFRVDIDDEKDWLLAESMFEIKNNLEL